MTATSSKGKKKTSRRKRPHRHPAGDRDILGFRERLDARFENGRTVAVVATSADGKKKTFEARIRIDTPQEIEYYKHGGILQYVLRQLAGK